MDQADQRTEAHAHTLPPRSREDEPRSCGLCKKWHGHPRAMAMCMKVHACWALFYMRDAHKKKTTTIMEANGSFATIKNLQGQGQS